MLPPLLDANDSAVNATIVRSAADLREAISVWISPELGWKNAESVRAAVEFKYVDKDAEQNDEMFWFDRNIRVILFSHET